MRYGLLALSIAMLTGGGVAAQSALDISQSAVVTMTGPMSDKVEHGGSYGSLPFTAPRTQITR